MKYLLYKDEQEEDWFIPRTGERYEFYVKSPISWKNFCDVRTIYRTVKKIRNYGRHNIPLSVDEADWQLICGKYPWFAHYDNEVQHKLGTLLLRLLALSIREGMTDVEKEIITQNRLDEEGLKILIVGKPAGNLQIGKDRLSLWKDSLFGCIRWKTADGRVGSGNCVYHEGNDFFTDGAIRHYLSEKGQEELTETIREIRVLKDRALKHEDGFQTLETEDEVLAFRPLPKDIPLKEVQSAWISSWNRTYYQFLLISKRENEVILRFSEWEDIIGYYNGKNFSQADQRDSTLGREAFLKDHAESVMRAAVESGDLYLLYMFKSFLHEQTEEECEVLEQMDGEPHYVAWQEEKTAGSLTILDAQCCGFSMFNRRPRYSCHILLDGKKYDTIWDPQYPQSIRVTEYHHVAVVHLTENQVRLFWEKVDADPDSRPFPGMPRKK